VIPADLGAELARAISAGVGAGELPVAAAQASAAGTWRPAPGRGPASYATSLPFVLGGLPGLSPAAVAGRLARRVVVADWIAQAEPSGAGYLTVTVTPQALAQLAVRIPEAGPACAASNALRGVRAPAPEWPDLAVAGDWEETWQAQGAALTGRLALTAGALPADDHYSKRGTPGPARATRAGPGSVAAAVAYSGADAVRYRLARALTGEEARRTGGEPARNDLQEPYYLVSFAHADAASTLRWAGDLGLARSAPAGPLAMLLSQGPETALLGELSWLAERVAGAARRSRPAELPRYLEQVARAWLDCREGCPALPFGGRAAPADEAGISARLWLADATRTVLAAGLELIGVAARDRL
jgi:arginyl-tRNA synthetase